MTETGGADVSAVAREHGRSGDAASEPAAQRLSALFEAHLDFIWRSLRRLGVPDAGVDDAAQKVFLVALRRAHDIEPGCERAFLFRTAMNIAADARRTGARSRERNDEAAVDAALDTGPAPDQALAERQTRALLDEVFDAMDEDLRTVFVLFELEGLTSPEIAALLGVPLGTTASRLRRAREQFQVIARRIRARIERMSHEYGGGT